MKRLMKMFLMISSVVLIVLNILMVSLITVFNVYDLEINHILNTGSMKPYFNGGEKVLTKKISDYSSIKNFDVLIFERDNRMIIHRVLDIKKVGGEYYFLMKGDANKYDDGYIKEDFIKRKYVLTLRK